ncbi:hypothetical protein SEUCBS140593_007942 [Sporothrix eucalyptigena]|uniref:Peptidase C14 caspase domain-containing protein n=1 Tax=Sporothrix eucalyptigena TaxID=1812306 RepID=A0ABP0CIR3_9PEZI
MKKALIIGINYYNQSYQLSGCINDATNVREYLVGDHAFPQDADSMVVMTDDPENENTLLYPTRANMMNALSWLVQDTSEGDTVWLSYSGHGGQTTDSDGNRPAADAAIDGLDTICPVDFESEGQIDSTTLHRTLVVPLHPQARLTILFDCCHSGSACALPYVYRPDEEGNVSVVQTVTDTFQQGATLIMAANQLVHAPLSIDTLTNANTLLHGFTGFAKNLATVSHSVFHPEDGDDNDGLVKLETSFATEEVKDVWMFSGCSDDQTSADTSINGVATGAMSWAFITAMRESDAASAPLSYIALLTSTRQLLKDNYSQIPQLSCDGEYDLDQAIQVRQDKNERRN